MLLPKKEACVICDEIEWLNKDFICVNCKDVDINKCFHEDCVAPNTIGKYCHTHKIYHDVEILEKKIDRKEKVFIKRIGIMQDELTFLAEALEDFIS